MNTDMDIDINTQTDTITCRLVEARADLGITQKELASATGISLENYCQYRVKTAYSFSAIRHENCRFFFNEPVTSLFCYHPGVQQTHSKGDDLNE